MKIFSKILVISILFFGISINNSFAEEHIKGFNNISSSSKDFKKLTDDNKNIGETTENIGYKIINWIRFIFSGVLLILIVYAGIQMILSMGTDDDSLSKSKRTIWYSLIGMIFINFPVQIYLALVSDTKGGSVTIVNLEAFGKILTTILTTLEIIIGGIAIFLIVYEGIKLIINSRKEEEALKNTKQRIVRIIIALISIGFIEIWIKFLKSGDINTSTSMFQSIANLALYAAAPIAIFFLTLAGYYYIFSNGDEEKMKKGRSIIINTSIGVVILLCIYVLLNDINLLKF